MSNKTVNFATLIPTTVECIMAYRSMLYVEMSPPHWKWWPGIKLISRRIAHSSELPVWYFSVAFHGRQQYPLLWQSTVRHRVAILLMKQMKGEIERMVQLGVIRVSEPAEWCAGMVVVPKVNNKVWICVHLTQLNESICWERHPLPTVELTLAQLAGAKVYVECKFRILPNTSIPWECIADYLHNLIRSILFLSIAVWNYLCARTFSVMHVRPVEWLRRSCLYVYILVHGCTVKEHDDCLMKVLQRLEKAWLTLNWEKWVFAVTSQLSETGCWPEWNLPWSLREDLVPFFPHVHRDCVCMPHVVLWFP